MHLAVAFGSSGVGGRRCIVPLPLLHRFPSKQRPKNGHLSQEATADIRTRSRSSKRSAFILTVAQGKEAHVPAEDEDEDENEDENEDEDDYSEMRQWEANTPLGFGHYKTYDTPLEDKLLAHVEQSHKVLVNKTKSTAGKLAGKLKDESQHKEYRQHKSLKSIPGGVNVRIGNLPKKKNIVRDLQASFKGYPGLLHINPVESGNKKTRDPICKGLAFVVFKNEDVANRFIGRYNGESIIFGKTQKKITCCLASPSGLTNSGFMSQTFTTIYTMPRLRIRDKGIHFAEGVTDSGVFQHQQKENHAKYSVNLESGHGICHNTVSGEIEVDISVRSGFSCILKNDGLDPLDTRPSWRDLKTNSSITSLNNHALEFYEHGGITETISNLQNDPHRDSLLYQDLDEGVQHSDNCPKISDDFMVANAGRTLENVGSRNYSIGKLGKLDVSEYREEQQEPPQHGSNIVQASGTQNLASKVKNLSSMKKDIASIVLTSQDKKQRQNQKGRKEHKSKKPIEANSSDTTAILLGSANRLNKKGRNVLSAVLVKYGQHAVSKKS